MEKIIGNIIKNSDILDQYELKRSYFSTYLDRLTFDCIKKMKDNGTKKISLVDISKYLEKYASSDNVTSNQLSQFLQNLQGVVLTATPENLDKEYNDLINSYVLRALKHLGLNTNSYEMDDSPIVLTELQDYYLNEINKIFDEIESKSKIEVFSPLNLPNSDKEFSPLIESMLLEETFNSIVAPAKAGKSQLGYQMAYCLQNGIDFLNKKVTACDVIYVDYELRPNAIRKRFCALDDFLQAPNHKQYGIISATSDMKLDNIIKVILKHKQKNNNLKVVFFDCFYRFTEGDRNKEEDQIKTLNKIKSLTEHGLAVIYIHHTNKISTVSYGNRKQDRINNAIYAAGGSGVHGKIIDETYVIVPNADGTGIIVNTGRDWTNDIIHYRKDESTNWFFQYDATNNSEVSSIKRREGFLTPSNVKKDYPDLWNFLGEEGKNTRTILKQFPNETKVTLKQKGFKFDSKKDKFLRP